MDQEVFGVAFLCSLIWLTARGIPEVRRAELLTSKAKGFLSSWLAAEASFLPGTALGALATRNPSDLLALCPCSLALV
jgi:hypothetical protein